MIAAPSAPPASLIIVPPPADLADHVEYLWQLVLTPGTRDAVWRVVADGYVDLSVRTALDGDAFRAVLAAPGDATARHAALDALASAPATVCGAATTARALPIDRPVLMTGARLRLGAAAGVLRHYPGDLVDGAVPLGDVLDGRTALDVSSARWDAAMERLRGCGGDANPAADAERDALHLLARETVHAAMRRLLARAESRRPSGSAPDARVREALTLLDRDVRGTASHDVAASQVAQVSRTLGVSKRTLERLFAQHVGFAPRTYQRLRRVGAVAQALERAPLVRTSAVAETLSDIAHRVGYADHAHMTREFGRVMGVAPSLYRIEASETPVPRRVSPVAFDRVTPVGTVGRRTAA